MVMRVRSVSEPIDPATLTRLRRVLAAITPVTGLWLAELALDGEDILLVACTLAECDRRTAGRATDRLAAEVAPLLPRARYDGVQFVVLDDAGFKAEVERCDDPVYLRR
jgi:hypothetical protein